MTEHGEGVVLYVPHGNVYWDTVCWPHPCRRSAAQINIMSILSDPKKLRFLVQVVLTLVSMSFYAAMIASDTDKNTPIFLPLLTASIGFWFSAPRVKNSSSKSIAGDVQELKSVIASEGAQRNAQAAQLAQQQQMVMLQQAAAARASASQSTTGPNVVVQ